jgi:hypothetical protein
MTVTCSGWIAARIAAWITGSMVAGAWISAISGCAATPPPLDVLQVSSERYDEAFDEALEVARRHGMAASVRDRRRGVIETEPAIAGSVLEPWKRNTSFDASIENTLAFQRRRARFEFSPAGESDDDSPTPPRLDGPDLLAVEHPQRDLLPHTGDLELRVWVYIERNYEPGLRRSTWTRGQTTQAILVPPDPDDPPLPREYWLPVSRDSAYERILLEQVGRSLASAD